MEVRKFLGLFKLELWIFVVHRRATSCICLFFFEYAGFGACHPSPELEQACISDVPRQLIMHVLRSVTHFVVWTLTDPPMLSSNFQVYLSECVGV